MGTVTSGIDVVELAEFGGASDLVFDLIAVFVCLLYTSDAADE